MANPPIAPKNIDTLGPTYVGDPKYLTPEELNSGGLDRWDPYGAHKPPALKIYKMDYKTGKPETLPHVFTPNYQDYYDAAQAKYGPNKWRDHVSNIHEPISRPMLNALYTAQQNGLKIKPEDVMTLIAQEGRGDLGGNDFDIQRSYPNNKPAQALYQKVMDYGHDSEHAGTAALMLAKHMDADRLNVPFGAAWNGTGESVKNPTYLKKGVSHTGFDYAREMDMNKDIINDPRNAPALNYIRQQMSPPPSINEINQAEYQRRLQAREKEKQAYIAQNASQYTDPTKDRNRLGATDMPWLNAGLHGLANLVHGNSPFHGWDDQQVRDHYADEYDANSTKRVVAPPQYDTTQSQQPVYQATVAYPENYRAGGRVRMI